MTAIAGPLPDADAAPGEDQAAGEQLRQALRQHPAGVAVVTAAEGRRPVGLTVTTFTFVSLSPALISLLVARSASVWPTFEQSARIGVHLLPAHARAVATTFARPGADRFAPPTRWVPDVHGVPVLHDAGVRLSSLSTSSYPSATTSWSWHGWNPFITPRGPTSRCSGMTVASRAWPVLKTPLTDGHCPRRSGRHVQHPSRPRPTSAHHRALSLSRHPQRRARVNIADRPIS